jgi:hypothetical protein
MTNFSVISIIFVAPLMSAACNRSKAIDQLRVGALNSTDDGKGQFGIVKILVLQPDAVHVRVYQQKFATRPTSVDPASLTLGKLSDKDSFSIGHLPLSRKTFSSWEPVFISQQAVSERELEGYKTWKEANGGVF